jgi:predicted nucleic acid-binding protein
LIIVDASVAVKWVIPESGTPEALKLQEESLAAPSTWIVECANVLWRHVKLGEMLDVEAAEWLARLRSADVADIPASDILPDACLMPNQLRHPIYDCL